MVSATESKTTMEQVAEPTRRENLKNHTMENLVEANLREAVEEDIKGEAQTLAKITILVCNRRKEVQTEEGSVINSTKKNPRYTTVTDKANSSNSPPKDITKRISKTTTNK